MYKPFEVKRLDTKKAEKLLAKKVKGFRVAASGALAIKGDVQTATDCIDLKQTEGRGYNITLKTLAKLTREARACGKMPVLVIEFLKCCPEIAKQWVLRPLK